MSPLIVALGVTADLTLGLLAAMGLVSIARGEVNLVTAIRRNLDVVGAVAAGVLGSLVLLYVVLAAVGPIHAF